MQPHSYILSPIALFVYKRPEHTRRTIESLIKNKEFYDSPFYVFCDAPRSSSDFDEVIQTRNVVKSFKIKNATIVEQQENFGLAKSIISGVTDLCKRYGRVIVLEDDLLVSPFFLEYTNFALCKYEKNNRIIQVSGHMFPVKLNLKDDAFFLPFVTSWGWATWDRAWRELDPSISLSLFQKLSSDKKLRKKYDLDSSYPYFSLLKKQILGKINSWAILWYSSIFVIDGLVLYPAQTLVQNIGLDGSGEHCGKKIPLFSSLVEVEKYNSFRVIHLPDSVCVDKNAFSRIKFFFKMRIFNILLLKLKNIISYH